MGMKNGLKWDNEGETEKRVMAQVKREDRQKAQTKARSDWYKGRTKGRERLTGTLSIDTILHLLRSLKKKVKSGKDTILAKVLKGGKK